MRPSCCWYRIAFGLALAAAAAPASAANRRAFVTSVEGTGDLGSWPDAGAAEGLAAGDAICQARAAAGGLPNPSAYRAWLSDDTTDAYCHVRHQTGSKGACAGGAAVAAGPWYQANGATAFTGSLDELTGSQRVIYRNLVWDEFLQAVDLADEQVWTGTPATGQALGAANCSDWSSASAEIEGLVGSSYATANDWTSDSIESCAEPRRLICLETGASTPFAPFWSPGALVFVTEPPRYGGDLSAWPEANGKSGLEAGDEICRANAAAARLPAPESFVAWLSSVDTDAVDRLLSNGPFRRPDGFIVANGKADLVDGTTQVSIHVTGDGRYLASPWHVLTATDGDGTWWGVNGDCGGWSDTTKSVIAGQPERGRSADWTVGVSISCGTQNRFRLYCFSNVTTLFWDGFESTGDSSRWSEVVGAP